MIGIPNTAETVRPRKLYEEVAARLEAMIHDGRYAPGDRLPSERELMKRFGVGRPAVREALFALQTMGLVLVGNGAPARVTRPTPRGVVDSLSGSARHLLAQPDGVRHFQQARRFLEVGLARHAALHATAGDLRRLGKALAANRTAIDDIAAFERTDMAFHYALAAIARNPIFTALNEAMAAWLIEQRRISLRVPGQNRRAYRAHEQIYDAVAARDPDGADKAMGAHLDQVSDQYWQVLEHEHERLRDHRGLPSEARNIRAFPGPGRRKR